MKYHIMNDPDALQPTGRVLSIRAILLSSLICTPMLVDTSLAENPPAIIDNGKMGFVITDFAYVLAEKTPQAEACPNGRTPTIRDAFAATEEGARRPGESDKAYQERLEKGSRRYVRSPEGESYCENPEAGPPVKHQPVTGDVAVDGGIDLDGQDSRADQPPAAGTCAHEDFRSLSGETGIDNQFFRLVGCSNGYSPQGTHVEFDIEMYTGAWGILITLSGVDDLRNDEDVEIGLYANADPIQLSPDRAPLDYATYAVSQDERFRSEHIGGRIVEGVLTSEPIDIFRVPKITNAVFLERSLRDARIRATISADGGLEGVLAGYTMVEEMYDFQFGFRNGVTAEGKPARGRLHSAIGSTVSAGMTCQGVYTALYELADGHPDPETGRCQSISTQYRIQARPAFVVDVATESVNSGLDLSVEPYD